MPPSGGAFGGGAAGGGFGGGFGQGIMKPSGHLRMPDPAVVAQQVQQQREAASRMQRSLPSMQRMQQQMNIPPLPGMQQQVQQQVQVQPIMLDAHNEESSSSDLNATATVIR